MTVFDMMQSEVLVRERERERLAFRMRLMVRLLERVHKVCNGRSPSDEVHLISGDAP